MSQFFQGLSDSTIPPKYLNQFNTDVNSPSVPINHIENVFGGNSTSNNNNGIQTDGSSGSNTLTVQLTNRLTGSAITTNNTLTTLVTLNLGSTAGVYYMEGNIIGFDKTNVQGASFPFQLCCRTTGAAAIAIAANFVNQFEEQNFGFILVQVQEVGNTVVVQVQGNPATTIDWNCLLTYRFVS